jgi:valyl-tRNA synthetase
MSFAQRYAAAEQERRQQELWARTQIYAFQPDDPRPLFAIDTPPPTVSGEIHIGHVYSYTQAEALARFWRMQGRNVFYPFGFDDNGLPTERYVERERGVRARDLPRAEFIRLCLETSQTTEDRFEAFWKRLGFSVDWRLRYSTIDPHARRISQWSFLDLHRKGRVYRQQAPNPWCVECRTAIAQAEIDDAERTTIFYTLAFRVERSALGVPVAANVERSALSVPAAAPLSSIPAPAPLTAPDNIEPPTLNAQRSTNPDVQRSTLPIATTRPELLPACVAVFVHPEDARYRDLVGGEALVPLVGRHVPILADEGVDRQKGTGAVMCCTFGDAADVAWWRTHRLPLIPLVTREGRLGEAGGEYAGLALKAARERIVADLRANDLLLGERETPQTVRIHERCKTPLEILETSQWFIRLLDAKDALLEAGRQIDWRPAHMRARYEHWVEHLSWDWCISRQRFYGVPFPVWHCESCGASVLADEAQLPVDPTTDAPPRACSCGSTNLRPDADVMDTWATSSVSPQIVALLQSQGAQASISELVSASKLLPMQLRPQAHDIIRTWAFYTIAKTHFHSGKIPWKTVMISGHGLAPDGSSIHKSLGNSPIAPLTLIERHGADAVRYWACGGGLGADQQVNEETMRQGGRLVNKLWSASRLVGEGIRDEGRGMSEAFSLIPHPSSLIPTDRALRSWLTRTIQRVTESFRAYEYAAARDAAERFFWGTLCDNYLELVKARLYDGSAGEREAAQTTLAESLLTVLKLLAPILPHVSEAIYQALFANIEGLPSIHVSPWPQVDETLIDAEAERAGEALIGIAATARRLKTDRKLGMGTPLARLQVTTTDEQLLAMLAECALDLRSVTRAREITFAATPTHGAEEAAPSVFVAFEV